MRPHIFMMIVAQGLMFVLGQRFATAQDVPSFALPPRSASIHDVCTAPACIPQLFLERGLAEFSRVDNSARAELLPFTKIGATGAITTGAITRAMSPKPSLEFSRMRGQGATRSRPASFQLNRRTEGRTRYHSAERQIHMQALQQVVELENGADTWERRLAIIQGSYYTVTGLWPIFHMQSFEMVTGPKTDDWLVKTVGAMIAVVGGTLLVSGLRDGPSSDLKVVAAGSAAALAIVDITYVARGRISRIYLLDAVAELALVVGWGITMIE